MVDSVTSAAVNAHLRAQQQSSIAGLKTNPKVAQSFLNQLQGQTRATVAVPVSAVPQTAKTAAPSANLPRGSLVDRLV